jgi:hypothetical protein
MIQKKLFTRLFVIVLILAICGGFIAPTTTHAEENGDAPLDLNDLKSIDEVDSINTYRAHLSIKLSGEAFELEEMTGSDMISLTIDGEFIKNPPAQHIMMSIDENTDFDDIEVIMVDGRSYVNIDGQWEETVSPLPDELIDAANQAEIPDTGDLFKRVGTETVNGRETVHYRADKESLAQASIDDPQAQQFFANAEEAQLDMWVDQSENFIVKMQIIIFGKGFNENMPDSSGRIEMLVEFYDFNAPITITAPTSPEPEPPTSPEPESAFAPEALPLAKSILEKAQE